MTSQCYFIIYYDTVRVYSVHGTRFLYAGENRESFRRYENVRVSRPFAREILYARRREREREKKSNYRSTHLWTRRRFSGRRRWRYPAAVSIPPEDRGRVTRRNDARTIFFFWFFDCSELLRGARPTNARRKSE